MTDKKLEYIARLLKKMSAKGVETYVISRIWHLLNDDRIKLIPQQYVRHNDGQYSLTDVYFPQFDIHIEVNEPGHYRSEGKISSDLARENNILISSGHQLKTINCNLTMPEVHAQVNETINMIKAAIQLQENNGTFKPWEPDFEYKASFYENRRELKVTDDVALETIEQICELFKVKVPKMGFLRKGAVPHNVLVNTIIWWPSNSNPNWENMINSEGTIITERARNEKNPGTHAMGILNNPHRRITFFKDRDVLGYTYYRFKGIFELDSSRSNADAGLCWVRLVDTVPLQFKVE